MSGSYKERLEVERTELDDKINKLQTFVATDMFSELDEVNRSLLLSQLSVMYTYHSILDMRILGVPGKVLL